jgi:hypothetical protein
MRRRVRGRGRGVSLMARAVAEAGDCERAGLLWGAIEDEDAGPHSAAGAAIGRTLDEAVALALDASAD